MSFKHLEETVPQFIQRVGDFIVQGSNNSLICLGRDRETDVDSGLGDNSEAGSISLVVGRKSNNLSWKDDSASFHLSMKSDPDKYIQFTSTAPKISAGESASVLTADNIVINARNILRLTAGNVSLTVSKEGITISIPGLTGTKLVALTPQGISPIPDVPIGIKFV